MNEPYALSSFIREEEAREQAAKRSLWIAPRGNVRLPTSKNEPLDLGFRFAGTVNADNVILPRRPLPIAVDAIRYERAPIGCEGVLYWYSLQGLDVVNRDIRFAMVIDGIDPKFGEVRLVFGDVRIYPPTIFETDRAEQASARIVSTEYETGDGRYFTMVGLFDTQSVAGSTVTTPAYAHLPDGAQVRVGTVEVPIAVVFASVFLDTADAVVDPASFRSLSRNKTR